jgi:hypothetical protein
MFIARAGFVGVLGDLLLLALEVELPLPLPLALAPAQPVPASKCVSMTCIFASHPFSCNVGRRRATAASLLGERIMSKYVASPDLVLLPRMSLRHVWLEPQERHVLQ